MSKALARPKNTTAEFYHCPCLLATCLRQIKGLYELTFLSEIHVDMDGEYYFSLGDREADGVLLVRIFFILSRELKYACSSQIYYAFPI